MARTPGQRAGLDRPAVLAAARDVLAERGAEGLSMRAVAGRAGVAPNALYSHVENRAALVDALLDDLLAGVPAPARDAEPAAGLRAVMLASFDLVARHPDLVPLYLSRQGSRGPHARALGDAMAVLLERGGITGDTVGRTVRALIVLMLGHAALATGDGPLSPDDLRADLDRGLGWLLAGAGLR
jgi:TetR/AcrR family transcriptional regulator, tetracycline repressor protein